MYNNYVVFFFYFFISCRMLMAAIQVQTRALIMMGQHSMRKMKFYFLLKKLPIGAHEILQQTHGEAHVAKDDLRCLRKRDNERQKKVNPKLQSLPIKRSTLTPLLLLSKQIVE